MVNHKRNAKITDPGHWFTLVLASRDYSLVMLVLILERKEVLHTEVVNPQLSRLREERIGQKTHQQRPVQHGQIAPTPNATTIHDNVAETLTLDTVANTP